MLPIVANARIVFYREKAANMYCTEAFALTSVSGSGRLAFAFMSVVHEGLLCIIPGSTAHPHLCRCNIVSTPVTLFSCVCASATQALVEIPYVTVQTVLYSLITFFMIEFEASASHFFWYFFFTWLCLLFFT